MTKYIIKCTDLTISCGTEQVGITPDPPLVKGLARQTSNMYGHSYKFLIDIY